MHDTAPCVSCQKRIVPQIIQRRRSFAAPRVQHLCPYCGAVQRESGGDFRLWFVVASLIVFPLSGLFWLPYGLWRLGRRLL